MEAGGLAGGGQRLTLRGALATDGSPVINSYLRFNVQGVNNVSSATLRLFAQAVEDALNHQIEIREIPLSPSKLWALTQ